MNWDEHDRFKVSSSYVKPISLQTIQETVEDSCDSTDGDSAEGEVIETMANISIAIFQSSMITNVDLSGIEDARGTIFQSGSLPEWIRNFSNLQSLKAPKCGLLVVDLWLVELNYLREIHLEHNSISTWPHFLRKLPMLQYICLDGNPCLEKAFCKSPSLRSLFFNWGPSKDAYKSVPRYIRGPEWSVAANARLSLALNVGSFGSYYGGIYTLSTPPDNSNAGLLTPLEPCPLQTRLMSTTATTVNCQTCPVSDCELVDRSPTSPHDLHDSHKQRQIEILMSLFDDIEELINRGNNNLKVEKQYVPLTGKVDVAITSFGPKGRSSSEDINGYGILRGLMKEEEHFCAEMRRAVAQFFSSHIHSSTVASHLATIFEWFPLICSCHLKSVYPALRSLVNACRGKSGSSFVRESDRLCVALKQAQSAYEWYAKKLNVSESYLDLSGSYANLYRDFELQEFVRRQLLKIRGMNYYLASQLSTGPSVNTMDYISRRLSSDMFKKTRERGPVSEWATRQFNKSCSRIDKHPKDYLFLPLFHIVRYERVFTILSYMDPRYVMLKATCREIRRHVAYRRRKASITTRTKLLMTKFRVTRDMLEHYRWDAVLSIVSRSYLEKGLLDPKTIDVYDAVLGEPASFVTEVFNENTHRLLRLICCGSLVQLWDEVFEQLIGTIERSDISVKALPDGEKVQVIFSEVREVCLASVKEFSAPYVSLKSDTQEFVEAFLYDKYTF